MSTMPPPPTTEEASGTATPFPPPDRTQILRALRAPALGYAWLLLGAVAMMVLILVATNVGATADDTGVSSEDTNAIGVLIGMPFQLAGMALLGSLQFTTDGVRASLFLPPLVLSALYAVMTARAARRSGPIPAAGTRALLGIISGFAAAAVLTPVTWAMAMRADGIALHAASLSLFFGVWVITGVASYVGASGAAEAVRPSWVPDDHVAAARLWLSSVGVWLVVAIVVLTGVAAVKEGVWIGILSPLWGVTAGLYSYALGHLGVLSFAGENVNIGDLGAVWAVLLVVGAIVLATITSIAWHLRRDTRATTLAQPGSWAVLPATYAVGGMLVWLVPTIVLGGGISAFGVSVTLQPAFWLVFVLAAWGAVVEAASRFLAPSLAIALPPRLHTALRGPERSQAPDGETAAAPVAASPLTAEERARYKKLGVLVGGVAVVGIVGWIAVAVVSSQFYGPEKQAAAYLDAVVEADLDVANDLARTDDDVADASLLTNQIYSAAENRVTGYDIREVDQDGDTVSAKVRLEFPDATVDAVLTLEKDGRRAVLCDSWRVVDGGLAKAVSLYLPEGSGDLRVNDVAVDRTSSEVWLLPGDYSFDAYADNPWLESTGEPVTVLADEDFQYAEVPGAVAADTFHDEVQRQVDAYLAECVASTELEPAGCPNSGYAGTDVRNVVWTLDQAPAPDFDGFDGSFPADLSYGESGRATVTYEADESYGFGPRDWQPQTEDSDLYLSSVIVTEDDGELLVTISD